MPDPVVNQPTTQDTSGQQNQGQQAAPVQQAPAQQQAPSQPNLNQQLGQQLGQQGQQQAPQSFRDQFGQLSGMNLSQYQDDQAAMRALHEQLRVAQSQQQFAQIGQQAMPHWSEFQKFLTDKQAAEAAAKAKQNEWWKAPQFDQNWLNQVERDPQTGELKLKAGHYDHSVLGKIEQFRQFKADSEAKFFQDPLGTLKPGLEPFVRELAQQIFKEQFGQQQNQQTIRQLTNQDAGWLYEKGQNGQLAYDQQGQPVYTMAGRMMDENVRILEQSGKFTDHKVLYDAAKGMTFLKLQQIQQQQAAQQQGQQGQQVQQQQPNNGPINRLQNLGNAAAQNGTGLGATPGLSLTQRLATAFQQAGHNIDEN